MEYYIYLRQALLFYLNASDIMQYWLNIKIKGIFDSKWIFKKVFNPFHASGLFLYPQKILENQGFCDVSRDIERDQWSEIASEENKLRIAFSLTLSFIMLRKTKHTLKILRFEHRMILSMFVHFSVLYVNGPKQLKNLTGIGNCIFLSY